MKTRPFFVPANLVAIAILCCLSRVHSQPLAGTSALTREGDLAAQMVGGIDQYLDRLLTETASSRRAYWSNAFSSREGFVQSAFDANATNRTRLRAILGVVDQRDPVHMRFVAPVGPDTTNNPAELGRGPGYRIYTVAWTVFRGIEAEGLLVQPDGEPIADIIAVPDCDWLPEQAVGLVPGLPAEQQFPRRFAEAGCRVLVPALIDRSARFAGNPGVRSVGHSQRETLWRAGYEMGRTPLGYEIQKILAAADWLDATRSSGPRASDAKTLMERIQKPGTCRQELGLVGYGEGGLLALYTAALDTRFLAVGVCGAFGLNARNPELPIYRNTWSLLRRFGDAEIATLIMPRALVAEHGRYPEVTHTDQKGGAPGRLWRPSGEEFGAEQNRFAKLAPEMPAYFLTAGSNTICDWGTAQRIYPKLASTGSIPQSLGTAPALTRSLPDEAVRAKRQYQQILEDTQWLMRESEYVRREFWKGAEVGSLARFTNSVSRYRDYFWDEIVGRLPKASLPPHPQSRFLYETNGYRGYEVTLDVHPDVFAYGILLVPTDIKAGEKRPVVVCQHGLEGRPRDVADPTVENAAYHRYACRLAERGFVTFAPQNPYIGVTRFRQVLRKAQPLGLTLFSFIVRQHETITDWLASLPFVDPARIGFYGLSYGGKTAMRVPPLVDRYCLSICSADYNEWIWKNVSARAPYSYLWTIEYDMPEFNAGNTFNYAEMSWLILPRPFMVERGHDDGVAPDEWVAYEFAKTRRQYVKLGLADRTTIEFFNGPHTINGKGTFDFLHQHLNWLKGVE
jgi:dienelactone hydrolase